MSKHIDGWENRSSGWTDRTYSVILPLNSFIRLCGFGRHLQPARGTCFQFFDLSDRGRSLTFSAHAEHASLSQLSSSKSITPSWGRICGGTLLHAPPCSPLHGWPCPGRSPAAGWSAPWWWHRDPGWPENPHTPGPHTTPQSPGSSQGSRATKRGHHWWIKSRFNTGRTEHN